MSRPPARPRKGFIHNEALANELASRFYAARGFEKFARVYLQDARHGLSALGSRWQGAALEAASSTSPRRTSSCISHHYHWHARRAAGCRDGAQGRAGGVGRDRTRKAHPRHCCGSRSNMPAPSVACSSCSRRRATDRGGGDDRPRRRLRSRCARWPCHRRSFPNPCSIT